MSVNQNSFGPSSIEFGDPMITMAEGIIAVGGELDVATLLTAYSKGIFPWPTDGLPLLWFSPERRGVLDFKELHIPRSLQKFIRVHGSDYSFSVNKAFSEVISSCQKQKREGQEGTWITPEMKEAYIEFHEAGFAHSIEVWRNEKLVGGIYGVLIGKVFSGESMFFKEDNCSKLAILKLVEWLKQKEITWIDTQMVTPVLASFGGKYISRAEFQKRIKGLKI